MTDSRENSLEILTWIGTGFILVVFMWSFYLFFTDDSHGSVLPVLGSCLLSMSSFVIFSFHAFVYENRRFLVAALLSFLPSISVMGLILFSAWRTAG